MYVAIGFLFAALIGVAVVPLVHNRAVRLTTRRLEAALPLQMSEIQADRDLLRADFAMSMRRLETAVERLRNKNASQLIELGKKSDGINRLKLELIAIKAAAAKVVATYSIRETNEPTVKRPPSANTRRRDGEVTRLLRVLARRRANDRASRTDERPRRAG